MENELVTRAGREVDGKGAGVNLALRPLVAAPREVATEVHDMPLTNRVTPEGEIIAAAARGTVMGNRGGRLHRADKTLGGRRWVNKAWIVCRLSFNGRQREVMSPSSYTELFFLDEATAFAAGHRPCFECRRQDAVRFAELFAGGPEGPGGRARAVAIDEMLHGERLTAGGEKATFEAFAGSLPAGTMVRHAGAAWLIPGDGRMLAWTPRGYGREMAVPTIAAVTVLTPRHTVGVLSAGYCVGIHASARRTEQQSRNSRP
jgi:hypothetical protein